MYHSTTSNNIYFVVNVIQGKYKHVNRNSAINHEKAMAMLTSLWALPVKSWGKVIKMMSEDYNEFDVDLNTLLFSSHVIYCLRNQERNLSGQFSFLVVWKTVARR